MAFALFPFISLFPFSFFYITVTKPMLGMWLGAVEISHSFSSFVVIM